MKNIKDILALLVVGGFVVSILATVIGLTFQLLNKDESVGYIVAVSAGLGPLVGVIISHYFPRRTKEDNLRNIKE